MASDIFFTTNPAEVVALEGLYISERNPPGQIRGADLSVLGIGGVTVRGPTTVQSIFSASRFLEVYGGRDYGSGGALVNQIWASLLNKPIGELRVRRVVAADAITSSMNVETGVDGAGTELVTIAASSEGFWGQGVSIRVEDASDGDADHWNLFVSYLGKGLTYENIDTTNWSTVAEAQAALDAIIGDDVARLVTCTVLALGRPENFATITEAGFLAAKNADDSINLGLALGAYTTTVGNDGTAVAADYNTALTDLANTDGVGIVSMAGSSVDQNGLNGTIVTEAALAFDRVFTTWSGTHGQVVATEITNIGTDITTRSDRIIWCFNSAYTLDPETGLEVQRPVHEWMNSILQNNDVDIHPGSRQTTAQTAGIRRLANESLTRADLKALRDAGICTMEKVSGAFQFRSGVTTDLTTGKTEITRRRSADFLQISAGDKLREHVKAKNTVERRALIAGQLVGFSQSLRDQGRIIEEFEIVQDGVNSAADRAQGIERILWRVKLIGHILYLQLETEIGTGVVIESVAA